MSTVVSPTAPDWGRHYEIYDLWSNVAEGLWVGGTSDDDTVDVARAAHKGLYEFVVADGAITKESFDSVVTLYAWAQPVDWKVEEYRWGIYDGGSEAPSIEKIRDVVAWAHTRWKSGERVLLRCQAGLSRSVFFTALVLIRDGWEPQDAIDHIRRQRSQHCFTVNGSSSKGHFYSILYNTPVEFWREGL